MSHFFVVATNENGIITDEYLAKDLELAFQKPFDFSDVFACVAPRPLVLEIGEKERAPGGFPVEIARGAFAEIRSAYRVVGAETNAILDVHPRGHVFHGELFWSPMLQKLGAAKRDGTKGTAATDGAKRKRRFRKCERCGIASRKPPRGLRRRMVGSGTRNATGARQPRRFIVATATWRAGSPTPIRPRV